jgi:hypothetical protein
MAKDVIDTQHLSPEARQWLDRQITRAERHVMARANLLAAQGNDDVVLPSHVEAAWNEVLGKRPYTKRLGIVIAVSAVLGGVIQGLFGGVGKSVGEYLLHFFNKAG